jgi:hypothetical protein
MKLSGSAAFLLYDALERAGVVDGRAFCLRAERSDPALDVDWPDSEDRAGLPAGGQQTLDAYNLAVDWPGSGDKVAVLREKVVLAIDKTLDECLTNTRLEARLEGDDVRLILCTSILWSLPAQRA